MIGMKCMYYRIISPSSTAFGTIIIMTLIPKSIALYYFIWVLSN